MLRADNFEHLRESFSGGPPQQASFEDRSPDHMEMIPSQAFALSRGHRRHAQREIDVADHATLATDQAQERSQQRAEACEHGKRQMMR